MNYIKEKCYNCQKSLEGNYGRMPITYKYCPKCGSDSNPNLKIEKHGFLYKWSIEIIYLLWSIFALLFMKIFWGKACYFIVIFMSVIAIAGTRLLYKTCPHCLTITCKRSHTYCHNCGGKFKNLFAMKMKSVDRSPK